MFKIITRRTNFLRLCQLVPHEARLIKKQTPWRQLCTESSPHKPDVALITNGDKDLEYKLKVLILEVDVLRQDGHLVPDEEYMKENHWRELLNLQSISSRRRYLEYLFKTSKTKENRQAKKEKKRLEILKRKSEMKPREEETYEEFVTKYDLQHNNLFLRIYDTTINQMYNNRLIHAMQFGQKLVVDCGFDANMNTRENKNCAKQLMLLFAENRVHSDPYDLHFCNINPRSQLMKSLHLHIATMYEPWFPLNLHESSYLDQFPREQLVYLTPHCREELTEYDHDAVYIIGGIVDKSNQDPLSLSKAKRDGLRMAKFPLDRYLQWGSGSGKSLTLNQVAAILLDLKVTGDWKYALRHVPKRKVIELNTPTQSDSSTTELRQRVWTPSKKIDFNSLSFKGESSNKTNRVKIRDILND